MTEQPPDQKSGNNGNKSGNKKIHISRRVIIIAVIIIIAIATWGIISRVRHDRDLNKETQTNAVLEVKITKPQKSAAGEEVAFPGTVQAWHEAPIYARTNGYLKSWVSDIGTEVKEGDLLATIETPEVDAQLAQAKADLATAMANNVLAQSTTKRWADLLKTDSVSKQEADEKSSDALAKAAAVSAAKANVQRLSDLESFKRVIAPFEGVITARNTDTGALINAGSSGTGAELFHIADVSKLRIYVQVPENYAPAITPDLKAELTFAEHPGKVYSAVLIKSADAIDPVSRTLLAEFEADNKSGELLAGGYTEVHLKVTTFAESLRLPSNTLMFRSNNVQIAVVQKGDDNVSHVLLKNIELGRDFGNDVEVVSGLNDNDQVILNPPDSLISGQKVKISEPDDAAKNDSGKSSAAKNQDGKK